MVVGDAVARPLADALAAARAADPDALRLPRLQLIASGGAVLSPTVKDQLRVAPARRRCPRQLRLVGDRQPGSAAGR